MLDKEGCQPTNPGSLVSFTQEQGLDLGSAEALDDYTKALSEYHYAVSPRIGDEERLKRSVLLETELIEVEQ